MIPSPGEPADLRAELARRAALRRSTPEPARAPGRLRALLLVLGAAGLGGGTLMLSRGSTGAALACFGVAMAFLIGGFPRNRSEAP
ncbi:hypothetical protein Asp14428_41030 [Actinoplanes sp. NBRC 14428]|uniref:DUF3040 family protein n=1 Tax=Pseudosporangium ferrugineum TaxID=439699 RepID=A0A2T0S878_9ACTN|nr:hypothetical protein [Pseudosporangium ferrugineum]PRY29620.1 hypothetical protein CLV70_106342 [Pseudosporangium ferrugineum]BCJ52628.1 hypothetical protein Asp14428_41030 [Actinoplanes sp. NBRC 14428]